MLQASEAEMSAVAMSWLEQNVNVVANITFTFGFDLKH